MKMRMVWVVLLGLGAPAWADSARVVGVEARQSGSSWSFAVTLEHADTGWEHYADGWGVYLEDGTELGYRVLHHPHVNEQPFTRSLGGVVIPSGTQQVQIQARDNLEGWAGELVTLDLADPSYAR